MPKLDRLDPRHGPMDDEVREVSNRIGALIGSVLPPEYGFALLVFGMGESKGRMNYISNARREDMIASLHELLARFEGRFDDKGGHA